MTKWEEVAELLRQAIGALNPPPHDLPFLARLHAIEPDGLHNRYSPHEEGAWAAARHFARQGTWPTLSTMEVEILTWAVDVASEYAETIVAAQFSKLLIGDSPLEVEDLFENLVCTGFENHGWMYMIETLDRFLDGWLLEPPTDFQKKR